MSTKKTGKKISRSAVFCEIGSDWIKAIRVDSGKRPGDVARAVMVPRDSGEVVSAETVRDVLDSLKASECAVYACLPRQAVTLRMLELPSTDPAEVADMVDLQVGKQTPYSKEEIVYDYRAVGGGGRGYTRVMLAIVQRSVLRSRYSLLEEAGANVTQMSISTEGVSGWYQASHRASAKGDGVLVLDVDTGYSDMVVMDANRLVFSRSILIGAAKLGSNLGSSVERLVREVQNSLTGLSAEAPDVTVTKLVVTGAGAHVAGLADSLSQQLGLPAEVEDSLSAASSLPARPDLTSEAFGTTSLTPLIGMALGRSGLAFDLVPESVSMRRRIMDRAKGLSMFGALVVALMMTLSAYGMTKVFLKQLELRKVQATLGEAVLQADQIELKKLLIRQVYAQQDVRFASVNVIDEIYRRVPEHADIQFNSFNYDVESASIQLGGTARSTRDIRALLNKLEESALLENVQEGGSTRLDRNTRRYTFKLDCTLEGADVS